MKRLFAAIDAGSYEFEMKIFEIGSKSGIREIDHIRRRIDLGDDTFHTGLISYSKMNELCDILKGFVDVMKTYRVEKYRAYGTSAIRETANSNVVLDQIKLRTGLDISILSNSEQRFLEYKSVASRGERFEKLIEKGTAIVDIGGGSTQVSLFDKGSLITSVNLHLGILRIRDKLTRLQPDMSHYAGYISEIILNELHIFKKLYLSSYDIKNIIVVDDYISVLIRSLSGKKDDDMISADMYREKLSQLMKVSSPYQMTGIADIQEENASLLLPSALIIDHILDATGAKKIWIPGVSLSDGIAYDYAQENKFISSTHDFEKDILSSVQYIAERYNSSQTLSDELLNAALNIFDGTKKIHGLGKRERLLLTLAAMMRDVGRYVTMSSPAEASFAIIMGSEIMGVSHEERKIIATVVRNSYPNDISYTVFGDMDFDASSYMTAVKLTAILRLATGLSRSTRKSYWAVKSVIDDEKLVITVSSSDNMMLEKGLFFERADTFEEVFGLRPVLKVRNKV
ncbi:MAG: exopolyphosphatase [Lachnospiraceae bacterium]|nr:exopolyphosphatase [Lachnospiraceae bacterium]